MVKVNESSIMSGQLLLLPQTTRLFSIVWAGFSFLFLPFPSFSFPFLTFPSLSLSLPLSTFPSLTLSFSNNSFDRVSSPHLFHNDRQAAGQSHKISLHQNEIYGSNTSGGIPTGRCVES